MRFIRIIIYLLLAIYLSLSYVQGQVDPSSGLKLDDEAYEQIPLRPMPEVRGIEIPLKISLRAFSPTPGDQGSNFTCVAWSLANTLTISKAIKQNITSKRKIDLLRHSEAYIYNQLKSKTGCEENLAFTKGLELLESKGDCLASYFSHKTNSCDEQPTLSHHLQAEKHRISGYERLSDSRHNMNQKIDQIRLAIARYQPVIVGIRVPPNFRSGPLNKLNWGESSSGHAMVIIGYNDITSRFELMNSYGPNWGKDGFFELDYEKLANVLVYSYTITLEQNFGDSSSVPLRN